MNLEFSDKMIILDDKTRRQEIIGFISNHPGCTRADINGGQIRTGYVTVSRIIKELVNENVVVEKSLNGNKRNKCLYVNEKHHLIDIPKNIEDFEQSLIQFLNKLKKQNLPTIQMLHGSLSFWLRKYDEEIMKKSNENKKTTIDYLRKFGPDPDLHSDLEELSIQVSPFIKALEIMYEYIRIYTQSIPKWIFEINDKKILGQLLFLVFDKISSMIAQVKDMVTPILRLIFRKFNPLPLSTNSSINLVDILDFYGRFGLRTDVESVLKHITKIRNNSTEQEFYLPLDEWGLNPLDVDNDVLEEHYNPDVYYNKQLKEELEGYPGEFDGIDITKKYRRAYNKSRKKS